MIRQNKVKFISIFNKAELECIPTKINVLIINLLPKYFLIKSGTNSYNRILTNNLYFRMKIHKQKNP